MTLAGFVGRGDLVAGDAVRGDIVVSADQHDVTSGAGALGVGDGGRRLRGSSGDDCGQQESCEVCESTQWLVLPRAG